MENKFQWLPVYGVEGTPMMRHKSGEYHIFETPGGTWFAAVMAFPSNEVHQIGGMFRSEKDAKLACEARCLSVGD